MQFTDNGFFALQKIAGVLRTTSEEVARSVGLGRDTVPRKERIRSDKTQRRPLEVVEIQGMRLDILSTGTQRAPGYPTPLSRPLPPAREPQLAMPSRGGIPCYN